MSNLIPLTIVNLALDAKDLEIKSLANENERMKAMLNEERTKIEVLLKSNYTLRNAVMAAIDLMDNSRSFADDERLRLQNLIRNSLA